jgi:hypothetical protein
VQLLNSPGKVEPILSKLQVVPLQIVIGHYIWIDAVFNMLSCQKMRNPPGVKRGVKGIVEVVGD